MSFDQAVVDLSAAVAQQLQTQLGALMAEAQASISALQQELEQERQGRSAADQQVQTIHAAIAEQLEHAEAEYAAEQTALAQQERRWLEQLDSLGAELQQERQWRQQLQQRIEALRHAAAALLIEDLPGAPMAEPLAQAVTIHGSGDGLLAGSGARL